MLLAISLFVFVSLNLIILQASIFIDTDSETAIQILNAHLI